MVEERSPCVEVMDYGGDRRLYRVTMPAAALPPVPVRELEAVLDAARAASLADGETRHRSFRFLGADGLVADFDLADPDARVWAEAVDRRAGLATLGGMSLCLRLLALVHLMTTVPWASLYLSAAQDGPRIDRSLLRAAARTDLTEEARFDEASFRRNLPERPQRRAGAQAFAGVSA